VLQGVCNYSDLLCVNLLFIIVSQENVVESKAFNSKNSLFVFASSSPVVITCTWQ